MISWFKQQRAKYKKTKLKQLMLQCEAYKSENEKLKIMNGYMKYYTKNANGSKIECCMCLDNIIDTVLVPCGHRICLECSHKVQECPICREPILLSVRYY